MNEFILISNFRYNPNNIVRYSSADRHYMTGESGWYIAIKSLSEYEDWLSFDTSNNRDNMIKILDLYFGVKKL